MSTVTTWQRCTLSVTSQAFLGILYCVTKHFSRNLLPPYTSTSFIPSQSNHCDKRTHARAHARKRTGARTSTRLIQGYPTAYRVLLIVIYTLASIVRPLIFTCNKRRVYFYRAFDILSLTLSRQLFRFTPSPTPPTVQRTIQLVISSKGAHLQRPAASSGYIYTIHTHRRYIYISTQRDIVF